MALTIHRRRIKRKRKALRIQRLSLGVITAATALFLIGQPAHGLLLLQAGHRAYQISTDELDELRHPFSFRDIYPQVRRCTLESFHEDQYHDLFRFDKPLVSSFVNYLTRFRNIPQFVRVPYVQNNPRQAYVFNIEEIILMSLNYLATPTRQVEIAERFGRTIPEVCVAMKYFHEMLFPISREFLQSDNQAWFDEEIVRDCADATARKGCPLPQCCGFVDGNLEKISDPSAAWLQNRLYNGHKKAAGYNWLGAGLPNGMCLLCLGPSPGRRHDAAVAARHGLYEKLDRLATFPTFAGCFSADKAFPTFWPLIPMHATALTPAQGDWNTSMSRVRIMIEWQFGETVEQFSSLAWKRRQKVLASPVHKWYLNCVFLNNLLNTSYPNAISQYFDLEPPSLEKYLNVPDGSLD